MAVHIPGSRIPKIAVVGDLMLDEDLYGRSGPACPEAPDLSRFRVSRRTLRPGGAANLAAGLAALDCEVGVFGSVGLDDAAGKLVEMFSAWDFMRNSWLVKGADKTTVKTRHREEGSGKLLFRADFEDACPLRDDRVDELLSHLRAKGPFDAIAVSDYAKGVCTPLMLRRLREFGVPALVDPKGGDWLKYGECSVIKANLFEACAVAGVPAGQESKEAFLKACGRLQHQAWCLVVTMGAEGCLVLPADPLKPDDRVLHYPTRRMGDGDPTGCGDSFMASLCCHLAIAGLPDGLHSAVPLALAAGSVCYGRTGVHAVTTAELYDELESEAGSVYIGSTWETVEDAGLSFFHPEEIKS